MNDTKPQNSFNIIFEPRSYTREKKIKIYRKIIDTPYGKALLEFSSNTLFRLMFINNNEEELNKDLTNGNIANWYKNIADKIFYSTKYPTESEEKILVKAIGTEFQISVWKALLQIPNGSVAAYSDIANTIGKPSSQRAVGNAVAQNPLHYLIPCHRVIRKNGELGGYAGGCEIKKLLLNKELKELV